MSYYVGADHDIILLKPNEGITNGSKSSISDRLIGRYFERILPQATTLVCFIEGNM